MDMAAHAHHDPHHAQPHHGMKTPAPSLNRLAVTATLENADEVEQLIAILTANKVLLPKKTEPATGAGAMNLD